MGRLKSGIYSEPNASIPENNYYNETLTYDLNGNVTTLKRNRNAEYIGVQLMDDLTYSYTGTGLILLLIVRVITLVILIHRAI